MFIKSVSILRIVPIYAILILGVKLERKACKSSFRIYFRRNPCSGDVLEGEKKLC